MQTTMMRKSQVQGASRQMSVQRAMPRVVRSNIVVRAEQSDSQQAPVESTSTPSPNAASTSTSHSVQNFAILNPTTEAINGRAAMLGFVAAIVSEAITHQAIWSQIVGKYVDLELVEKPIGASSLGFGMFVAIITLASLAPKLLEGVEVDGKAFGPFTPSLERNLGRVAQMGFLGLVVVEVLKGSSLL